MEASTGAVVGFFAILIAIAAVQGWSAISPGVVTVLFAIYVPAWLLGSSLIDWWRYREK